MLSAYDERGHLVCLVTDDVPIRQVFSCPACGQLVLLKAGNKYRPHFAHKSLRDCAYHQENESTEHLELKAALYQALSKTEQVAVERVLPDLGQIADLLVGDKLALEVQCSPLSLERFKERTLSYQENGYQVLWLLGQKLWLGKKLSQLQRSLLSFSYNVGFYLWELDLKTDQIRLKYLIHEDLEGKVYYLTKTFSLSQLTLACLRQPFVRQTSPRLLVKQNQDITTYIQKQLYYGSAYWLQQQEKAYEAGDNLLTKSYQDFYPQVRPPKGRDFLQIREDLSAYEAAFFSYYDQQTNKTVQTLHAPAYLLAVAKVKGLVTRN